MEATAQREIDLHKKVGDELKAIGQSAQTVPATEQSVLSKGIEIPNLVPEEVDELFLGRDPNTYVGRTPGENWRQRLIKRAKGLWK